MKIILTFVVLCLSLQTANAFAKVKSGLIGTNLMKIELAGQITKSDFERVSELERVVNSIHESTKKRIAVLVSLNSIGGDVHSAMGIGRILRRLDAAVNMGKGDRCISACVFVLAGATHRFIDGIVGIHRPYDPKSVETSSSAQKNLYKSLGNEVRAYLEEMNMSSKLYEDMLYISPERVKILTQSEMAQYGLNQNDPYQEEADAAAYAKRLGISRQEFARREALQNKVCSYAGCDTNAAKMPKACEAYFNCRERVIRTGKP